MTAAESVVVIDPDHQSREALTAGLVAQGFRVLAVADPCEGALAALSDPPSAVIADLWMPNISGVQLCRLLKGEPATDAVPVLLRGPEGRRNRFWSDRAGATAYVVKDGLAELTQALRRAIAESPPSMGFSLHLTGSSDEVRDRIASHLDAALFDSVIASEVRSLGMCGDFGRLFDLLSRLMCQLVSYRWMAIVTDAPFRFAVHTHPEGRSSAEAEARLALGVPAQEQALLVEDDGAEATGGAGAPLVMPVRFVDQVLGRIAVSVYPTAAQQDSDLLLVVARELGGAIRMTTLVEEARRLATIDPLTGLTNRRAFLATFELEIDRSRRHQYPLAVALLDIDHFKQINDRHGHASGDAVLAAVGRTLLARARSVDLLARWGGEEFVIAFSGAQGEGARLAAERLRLALAGLVVMAGETPIPVTASFGFTELGPDDTPSSVIDRADRAMYAAKEQGRNRLCAVGVDGQPARARRSTTQGS